MDPRDLKNVLATREGGKSAVLADIADNAAGCIFGPLVPGKYVITTNNDMYWIRGASTLAGTDVKVDESTPSTDMPLRSRESYEFIVEQIGDDDYTYVAARTVSGNPDALVHVIFEGNFANQ